MAAVRLAGSLASPASIFDFVPTSRHAQPKRILLQSHGRGGPHSPTPTRWNVRGDMHRSCCFSLSYLRIKTRRTAPDWHQLQPNPGASTRRNDKRPRSPVAKNTATESAARSGTAGASSDISGSDGVERESGGSLRDSSQARRGDKPGVNHHRVLFQPRHFGTR